MRELVNLKESIVKEDLDNLYVFYGPENMIRKIYYQKIGEIKGGYKILDNMQVLIKEIKQKSLFNTNKVYVIYNDEEFLDQNEIVYKRLTQNNRDKIVILIYDEIPDNCKLKKYLDEYITYFGIVSLDIATKYIYKESKPYTMAKNKAEQFAFNCHYNYGAIIEEMNKFKYASQFNLDEDQLFINRMEQPTPKQFADAFLKNNTEQLKEFINYFKVNNINCLAYLPELYSSISVAIFIKYKGKWEGSKSAYDNKERWGRIKEIRDFNIKYNSNELNIIRNEINNLDVSIRKGIFKAEYLWDWIIGVIL